MDTRRCLKIADRINALLLRQLRHGIDRQRMVDDPLYARGDLASLAKLFRLAAADVSEATVASGGASSGFSASRFLSSIFGPISTLEPPPHKPAGEKPRSWFGGK